MNYFDLTPCRYNGHDLMTKYAARWLIWLDMWGVDYEVDTTDRTATVIDIKEIAVYESGKDEQTIPLRLVLPHDPMATSMPPYAPKSGGGVVYIYPLTAMAPSHEPTGWAYETRDALIAPRLTLPSTRIPYYSYALVPALNTPAPTQIVLAVKAGRLCAVTECTVASIDIEATAKSVNAAISAPILVSDTPKALMWG